MREKHFPKKMGLRPNKFIQEETKKLGF